MQLVGGLASGREERHGGLDEEVISTFGVLASQGCKVENPGPNVPVVTCTHTRTQSRVCIISWRPGISSTSQRTCEIYTLERLEIRRGSGEICGEEK